MNSQSSLAGKSSAAGSASKTPSAKSDTVNYLLLYEAMVRHQDLEYDATHDHIALTANRIRFLGRKSAVNNNNRGNNNMSMSNTMSMGMGMPPQPADEEEGVPKGMLTYLQMRRCLLRLGYTWNRSVLPASGGNASTGGSQASGLPQADSYYDYDDDVSVMSTNSAGTFISGGGASSASSASMMAQVRDIIATDAQLIMLLTTLVEMEERHRATKLKLAEHEDDDDEDEKEEEDGNAFDQGLFLPEFIQAYKLIIGGMQSLQTYPNPGDPPQLLKKACAALGMPVDKAVLQDVLLRSRERTLGLLRLFGPESDLYAQNGARRQQSAGESSTARGAGGDRKTRSDGLKSGKNRSAETQKAISAKITAKTGRRGGKQSMVAKDGLLPRLTEEEIRAMVHSKDAALAKILEEHESEMNVMASNMEQLRSKGLKTAALLRRRRKRTRIAAVLGMLLLVVGGGVYEFYKREQVKVEIATGREAERRADSEIIRALEKDVKSITSKLNDAEATIRYEEGRYDSIKSKYESSAKTLKESERKWLVDQRDLEKCRVSRKELDVELSAVKARNEETEEEVGWCRERLVNAERAMEGMERALKKKQGKDLTAREKREEDAAEALAEDVSNGLPAPPGEGYSKGSLKPVKMEMKYNKSFRNAVILRQVYSAAGGILASLIANAIFPGLGKVLGLMV